MKKIFTLLAASAFAASTFAATDLSEVCGSYNVDNFSGLNYFLYSEVDDWDPFEMNGYEVQLVNVEGNQVALENLAFEGVSFVGNYDAETATISFPYQIVQLFNYDYIFCKEEWDGENFVINQDADVVATINEDGTITFDGWTLAYDYGVWGIFVGLKEVKCTLSPANKVIGGPDYTAVGNVTTWESWGENLLAPAIASVDAYNGYVIIRAFAGVEGYDMKVVYDADDNVTGVAGIVDGVEEETVTSGYAYLYTGREDYYCLAPYVGTGYSYAGQYVDDNGMTAGYALLSAWFYTDPDNCDWSAYYVDWVNDNAGIAGIEADENAPVEYYNLNGVRVENPSHGIYIVRQGSKVTKRAIR